MASVADSAGQFVGPKPGLPLAAQPTSAAAFYFLAIIHDQLNEYLDAMANYQQYLKLADPGSNKLEIEKVNLRLPGLQKQIKDGKGKKTR